MTMHSSMFLISLVFGLGLRHGLDLDHLATIDSMTRTTKNTRLAKRVGFLFSLGHGLVVMALSVIISQGLIKTQSPLWLETFGSFISIFFLLFLGVITLWNTLFNRTKSHITGLRSALLAKQAKRNYNSLGIMLIGALFALSFDTFTQVALFSVSTASSANWLFPAMLATVFMLGMMTTDGLNGLLMSSVIQRADKFSFFISRILGFFIACFSLLLGVFGLYTQLFPTT